jgi:hypothetical protein
MFSFEQTICYHPGKSDSLSGRDLMRQQPSTSTMTIVMVVDHVIGVDRHGDLWEFTHDKWIRLIQFSAGEWTLARVRQ